jgi:threonine dehydrogenase-like Zn-dependent dehydrogenase
LADVSEGDVVAVFGCGPVGQLAIISAMLQGASRVIAVDGEVDRLNLAKARHAEIINFNQDDPIATMKSVAVPTM